MNFWLARAKIPLLDLLKKVLMEKPRVLDESLYSETLRRNSKWDLFRVRK
jgi:hypothetical protein